jgi:membrane protein implicated in regulation of membrane protease activity
MVGLAAVRAAVATAGDAVVATVLLPVAAAWASGRLLVVGAAAAAVVAVGWTVAVVGWAVAAVVAALPAVGLAFVLPPRLHPARPSMRTMATMMVRDEAR